jgi:hypothetical protein
MALSNLTFLNNGIAPNISYFSFNYPPTSSGGNLESEIRLSIIGYSQSNANLLVFSVYDGPRTQSALSLKSDNESINLTDTADNETSTVTSWYSIDMGTNVVTGTDWSLKFNITLKDLTTPSFVFVKGKPTGKERPN